VPPGQRHGATLAIHSAFASSLNEILVVGAVVAFAGAALALVLIRGRDFAVYGAPEAATA
jgi:hypothetical protein